MKIVPVAGCQSEIATGLPGKEHIIDRVRIELDAARGRLIERARDPGLPESGRRSRERLDPHVGFS